jgi:hypothetical protein
MLTPRHRGQGEAFARLLAEIRPDEVQLSAPLRPVPHIWFPEGRGNGESAPVPARRLRTISREEAARFESRLHELTGLKIVSVFRPGEPPDVRRRTNDPFSSGASA